MFRKREQSIGNILNEYLRKEGLETPLRQKRLIDAWEKVVGHTVNDYTEDKFIKNQTLYVKITSPALRQDLSMMRKQLVKRLNEECGAMIITEVRLF
ncbi:MAG: DUF721 domain-containing protein [Prevotella sp.]